VHYSADFAVMRELVDYLSAHCCAESGEICSPVASLVRTRRSA
jgi:hypothetical protein